MQCSTSVSRSGPGRRRASYLARWSWAAVLSLFTPIVAGASWQFEPGLRVGGGHESDLVLDPGVTRELVDAGAFLEFVPSFRGSYRPSSTRRFDVGSALSWQNYGSSTDRRLYAQSLWADGRWALTPRWLLRMSASADVFDDSERIEVRRFGAGAELGLARVFDQGAIEVWGGGRARRYPELPILDGDLVTYDYAEGGPTVGTDLRYRPSTAVTLDVRALVQTVDARSDDFDSRSWSLSSGLGIDLTRSWRFMLFGSLQRRSFTERVDEDSDAYAQGGLGLAWTHPTVGTIEVRAALARTEWPDQSTENSHRISLSIRRGWTVGAAVPAFDAITLDELSPNTSLRRPDARGRVTFRVRAPEATSVHLAGDFNAWNDGSHAMEREDGGWWTVAIPLDFGRHEYVYVIDGTFTTPPEATTTVDDGFGGRNGVIEVLGPGS